MILRTRGFYRILRAKYVQISGSYYSISATYLPRRKYVKINDNVEIISVENWKQYNCDMSEKGQKHIICQCCIIL